MAGTPLTPVSEGTSQQYRGGGKNRILSTRLLLQLGFQMSTAVQKSSRTFSSTRENCNINAKNSRNTRTGGNTRRGEVINREMPATEGTPTIVSTITTGSLTF